MTSLRRSIFSPSLDDVLSFLGEMSDEAYSSFLEALASDIAFDQSDEHCQRVAAAIDSDAESVRVSINAIAYLYGLASSRLTTDEDLLVGVDNLLGDLSERLRDVNTSLLRHRLLAILKRDYVKDRFRKVQRLKEGFIPNAASFGSMVDLRPNFDESRDRLQSFIPVIQFRVITDSNNENDKFLVVQMDEDALKRLEKETAEIRKKLDCLKMLPEVRNLILKGKLL